MKQEEVFAAAVTSGLDPTSFGPAARELLASTPVDLVHPTEALELCYAMAAARAAAIRAYDMLAPKMGKAMDGLGAAILALDSVADKLSAVAIDIHHDGLPPLIDELVEATKSLTEMANRDWKVVVDLQAERIASVCGLGRKIVTGEAEFSPASTRELADIVTQMAKDGEAHALMIFLHGGGEELTVAKVREMSEAGTFPVSGYPHPGPLECERFVAWARSRMKFAQGRIADARDKYGFPTSAALADLFEKGECYV